MKKIIKKFIPLRLQPYAREVYLIGRGYWYYGTGHYCPISRRHLRKFMDYGNGGRQCSRCLSLDRHRLLWLYLERQTDFFRTNLKVLDIAPDGIYAKIIQVSKTA